jgi:hypothetical protein
MVFPGYVAGAIEVGVDFVSAGLALKNRLRRSIAPVRMPALVAALACMPGIDTSRHSARRFCLIFDITAKPGITPRVVPSPLLASTLFAACVDFGQVLDHNKSQAEMAYRGEPCASRHT